MKILVTGGRGYIGGALSEHLRSHDHKVTVIDSKINIEYQRLDHSAMCLEAAAVVIHLAGHSSVQSCETEPWDSARNNVVDFLTFVETLSDLERPPLLLWASSGSVLSNVRSLYDEQKRALEALVPALYPNSVRLRFGSVCGASPNPRHDIILNSMVKSAVETGTIKVANLHISKPILGLKDLCRALEMLLEMPADDQYPNAVAGLCSFVTTPMRAACAVHAATGAKIVEMPESRAYDFTMRPWASAEETLDSIVADLVEFYRDRVDAEGRHRV